MLVACEYSREVAGAFERLGHYALSCDFEPAEKEGNHYKGDVRDVIEDGWDIMVAHPPCTYLTSAGARWFKDQPQPKSGVLVGAARRAAQGEAVEFVRFLMEAPIPHIALENPVGRLSSLYRKPDQIIQPWQFGHMESKGTCLWLKNLPLLTPTDIVRDEMMKLPKSERERVHMMPPGKDRWKERSRTYTGIADALAKQYSQYVMEERHAQE